MEMFILSLQKKFIKIKQAEELRSRAEPEHKHDHEFDKSYMTNVD
jgi:hypothetical protein